VRPGRFIVLFLFVLSPGPSTQSPSTALESSEKDWVLTWSDEFNAPNGSPPDPAQWLVETSGNGSANNELQYYTTRRENLRHQDGNLVIEARRENYVSPSGVTREYTSARLNTSVHFTQKYGRFEARIQIPFGQGMWPAFWLLGDDISAVGWPRCGEIDIMENVGREPDKVHGTLHGPGYFGDDGISSVYTNPSGRVADAFHIYALEWEPNAIRFYMDGQLYATKTPADLPPHAPWVYDHPFFIILNLAVGGKWPGNPDTSTVFPQRMLVDYVRVYSKK
jgi:beta-glucanase (GH16 family)